MLVALSPSIHRLRMSSLDFHGDATTSRSASRGGSIAQGGASPVKDIEETNTIAAKSRPRLSLQTSSLPSPYAKSSQGVLGSAIVITGTATPTRSNTIANSAQAIPLRPSPATPRSSFSRPSQIRHYTQPIGLRSILKKAPDSPKLGIKRSHSLFSADSDSPHTTRRVFFPPAKKVKFECDEKLAVDIPTKEPSTLQEPSPTRSEHTVSEETSPPSETTSDEEYAADTLAIAAPSHVRAAPRTRNGTPPPTSAPSRKKRKVRKWEWTITSPRLPKSEGGT